MNDPKRVLLVALGTILLLWAGFGIRSAINDSGEETARLYNTAIQATEGDRFNYAIDSRQGRLLGTGEFTATAPAKFPEMSKAYALVEKTREEYTKHESCSTDDDGNETCTTYYTWDWWGSDEQVSPTVKLYGREYSSSLFNIGSLKRGVDACEFTKKDTSGWFQKKDGCDGRYFYTDSDTRYYYDVVDTTFTASMIADVSDGSLRPLKGNRIDLKNSSVDDMIKDANNYKWPGNIFIVFWFLIVIGGMGYLAYAWAVNTIEVDYGPKTRL